MRLMAFLLLASCAATPTCPIDLADSGCVPSASALCADAGDEQPCTTTGTRCTLCVPNTYHSYALRCDVVSDGGARWVLERGIPPLGCPPE